MRCWIPGLLSLGLACGPSPGSDEGPGSSDDASRTTTTSADDPPGDPPGTDSSGAPAECMPALDFDVRPTAERIDGDAELRLLPSGLRFAVPASWAGGSFLLTADELATAEHGEGEWSTELAAISNALIDFQTCAAHFGRAQWPEGASALWVRVYVLDTPAVAIEAEIMAAGVALAQAQGGSEAAVEQDLTGPWRRTTLRFRLWYGDYGGDAWLDYRMVERGGATAVFLFMGSASGLVPEDHTASIDTILDSACLPDASTDVCCE